jgi:hypothetical protein
MAEQQQQAEDERSAQRLEDEREGRLMASAQAVSATVVKLRSSDDQIFELNEPAARQCHTLKNMMDDTALDRPVKVPCNGARLHKITECLTLTVALVQDVPGAQNIIEHGIPCGTALTGELRTVAEAMIETLGDIDLTGAACMLNDLDWFDAPLPTSIVAERVARILSGMTADTLRTQLGAPDDLTAEQKQAALSESLFSRPEPPPPPPDSDSPEPPQLAHSISIEWGCPHGSKGSSMQAFLERCDWQTLQQVKAVSSAWQRRAGEVLEVSSIAGRVTQQALAALASDDAAERTRAVDFLGLGALASDDAAERTRAVDFLGGFRAAKKILGELPSPLEAYCGACGLIKPLPPTVEACSQRLHDGCNVPCSVVNLCEACFRWRCEDCASDGQACEGSGSGLGLECNSLVCLPCAEGGMEEGGTMIPCKSCLDAVEAEEMGCEGLQWICRTCAAEHEPLWGSWICSGCDLHDSSGSGSGSPSGGE